MGEETFHDEPVRGQFVTAEVLGMPGIDMMRGYQDGSLAAPPLTRMTGLRPTEVGPGMATFSMPASPWWQTGAGVFPAGVFPFVADGPLGGSVITALPPGVWMTTSQLSMDFLRTATLRSGTLNARSRVVHLTKTLALSEVTVEDATGRMLAHGTARSFLIRPDESMLPEQGELPEPADADPDPYQRPVVGEVRSQDYWNQTPGPEVLSDWILGGKLPPVMGFLGLVPVSGEPGTMVNRLRNSPWTRNGMGVTYGGVLAAAADLTMSSAILSTLPAGTAFAPLDLKVSYLRPVRPGDGDVTLRATINHRGRSIVVLTCEMVNEAGKPVCVASESVLVLPGRPWDRAIAVSEEEIPL
jgi:uncharacterized protein (TIGR00369 family)